MAGRKLSAETRARISAALRGKPKSEAHRASTSAALKGVRRARGPDSPHWKGDNATVNTGYWRAHTLYTGPLACEVTECDRPAQRHHRDKNPLNNQRDNIQFLCAKHHMQIHAPRTSRTKA